MATSGLPNLLDGTEEFMHAAGQLSMEDSVSDTLKLRKRLLREEVKEYFDAEDDDDVADIIQELLDIIVVAWGSVLAYIGPDFAKKCAAEIVRANLDKIVDGKVIKREDGKILKPEGWKPADILGVIHGDH